MKNIVITAAVALLVGLGLGSQVFPKLKTEIKEKEVEVIVKDIVTVTKIITKPDGTKEEVITVTDKTKENSVKSSSTKVLANNWHSSIGARTDSIKMDDITYSISVERRIIGDVYLGVNASTKKEFGLSIGMSY